MAEPSLVVFDGVCNLCNGAVQFIIKRDPKQRFIFSPAQSPYAQARLAEHGLADLGLESVVLIENGQPYLRTDAALRIAPRLSGLWFLLAIFWLMPKPLRDWFYKVLASHRYQWFGRRQRCLLPSAELAAAQQQRFRVD